MTKFERKDKNLILFFIIAIGWSWIFWFLEIILNKRFYVAPFGPTFAAFLLTFINEGKNGLKQLLKRGISLNFKKIWLIPVFFLMPVILGLSLLAGIIAKEKYSSFASLQQPFIIIPAFFYILFLGGPLAEEFGWRGYALDRLQVRFNALISSIILGFIWGLWHLPLFFMKDQSIYHNIPVPFFILGTVLLSTLLTWIYNNTNRSIFACLIFHTMGNLSHYIFPVMESRISALFSLIFNLIATIIIIVISGAKKFIRQ